MSEATTVNNPAGQDTQALQTTRQTPGIGAMMQMAPQPQGQPAQIIPLDRETLLFYGNMITAANLVPSEQGVNTEISRSRVMAKIIAGTSYGFDPILAQQCFDVVKNRMVPNAFGMEILFRDSGEYDTRIAKLSDDYGCKVLVLRRVKGEWDNERAQYSGGEWTAIGEVEFTIEMAKKAGLWDSNPTWKKYPSDMAYSKVMKRVVKRYNPTCLRPRLLLGNHFAKTTAAPQIAAAEPPPQEISVEATNAGAAAAEPYRDRPFVESEAAGAGYVPGFEDDDSVEAEIVEFSGPAAAPTPIDDERDRADDERLALRDAVTDREKDVAKAKNLTVANVRNGRDPKQMDTAQLRNYYAELDLM